MSNVTIRLVSHSAPALVLGLLLAACNFQFGGGGNQVSALDLERGMCFNGGEGDNVGSVSGVNCDEPHENEVFAVLDYPAGSGEEYPGDEELSGYAETECTAEFEAYVGLDYESSRYHLRTLTPSEDTWANGDREVVCILYDPQDDQLEGSARGSGE